MRRNAGLGGRLYTNLIEFSVTSLGSNSKSCLNMTSLDADDADIDAGLELVRNLASGNLALMTGCCYIFMARRMLMTMSAVIMPVSSPFSSTTGRLSRLYLSKSAATLSSLAFDSQEITSGAAISLSAVFCG